MYTRPNYKLLFTVLILLGMYSLSSGQSYIIDTTGTFQYEEISPNEVILDDDELSGSLPIGFDFDFFGFTYSDFFISSNGFITFDMLAGDGCCSGQLIPDANDPNNLIALAWEDLNVEGEEGSFGYYAYETVGTPGSRKLIVTFSTANWCYDYLEGQIWLYEGSNIIELHIDYYYACNATTQGIENDLGTAAFFHEDRNSAFWEANFDYIAFIPAGSLPENDAGVIGYVSSYCSGDQSVFTVIKNFGGNDIDSVTVNWEWDGVPQTPFDFDAYTIAPGQVAGVVLGTKTFVTGQTYSLKAWTSDPNGVMDTVPLNDTLSSTAQVALSGSYTIGGTSPDYVDFASAIADLVALRYCDTVIFNVRSGTYNEQVLIPSLIGLNGNHRVIFQSESGDSSDVTVVFNATDFSSNYVLRLDNADNITFRNLTFEAVEMNYGRVFEIINGSDSTEILNCHLKGYGPGSSSSSYATLYTTGSSVLRLQDSRISQGSRGVYCSSEFGLPSPNNWQIKGNIIDSMTHWSIYMYDVISPDIQYNDIRTYANTSRGMVLSTIDEDFTIAYNRINMMDGDRPIDIYAGNTSQVGEALIHNNFMYCGSSSLSNVLISSSNNIGFYHNSINHYSSSSAIGVLDINGSMNINVHNNNIVNLGPGFAFSTTSAPNITMDHNNLKTNGVNLVSMSGFPQATLSDWVTASGLDSNSISVDPMFVSPSDLHTTQPALFRVGSAISGIGLDIDGDIRHVSTPDIGADEVPGFDDNIAPLLLFPESPFPGGTQPIDLVVRNMGSNAVTSFNIDWTVNGVAQSQFVFAGSLAGLASDTFSIGSVMFELGTPYTIRSWTSLPNNTADAQPANDTLQVDSLYAALGGVFTIGGASPDFDSIGHAVLAMTLGGVLDTTVFLLRNGTYAEAITLPANSGFTCERPVIFESESGDSADVIWTDAGITGVPLTLSGADGLQFKNLTIQSVDGNVVSVFGGSNCNRFEGCHLIGESTTSTSTSKAVLYSSTDVDTANVFINNLIEEGSYGMYWRGNSFFPYETGTIVRGNTIQGQRWRGLSLNYQDGSQIVDNEVTNADIGTSTYNIGILCSRCNDDMRIEGNNVQLTGKSSYAIYLEICSAAPAKTGLIANNFIQLGGSSAAYGVYVVSSSYQDIYYNSIKITGTHASSVDVYTVSSSNNIRLQNNILVNESGGLAIRLSNETQLSLSDNNDLISTGDLAITDMGTYSDLAAWQGSGFDANSLSVDPQFTDSLDLHVLNVNLNGAAVPLAGVTDDIDDEARDVAIPDIGADEFVALSNDVGLQSVLSPTLPFPSGISPVTIRFFNNGLNNLTSMQVDWEFDGTPQAPFMWTGSLGSGATSGSLQIGNIDFAPFDTHSIKIWVSEPNGMTDGEASNDTIEIKDLYPALLGDYTIGGIDPDASKLSDAITGLGIAGVLGPVTFNIRDGIYTDSLVLNAYPGMDCNTPVIIQSESKDSSAVTISNMGIGTHVLTLDGVDGLIVQHLTFEAVNVSYRRVIHYFGGSDCNTFRNNHLKGYVSTQTSSLYAVIYSPNDSDLNNTFENNLISDGSYGFYIRGANNEQSGTVIRNNNISMPRAKGIDVYRKDGIVIEGNTIHNAGYSSFQGIYFNDCDSSIQILNNTVIAESGRYGVYLNACDAVASQRSLVANNFAAVGGTSNCFAFYNNGSDYIDFVFNSGHNYTTKTNNSNNRTFDGTNCNSLRLYNNIFSNSSAEGEVLRFNNSGLEDANYNCYHNTSLTNYIVANGYTVPNLMAWQDSTALDTNSIDTDPTFVSDTNLHTTESQLDEAGALFAGVTTDIDGDVRDALLPDIGADEFTVICDTCWQGGVVAYVDSAATGADNGTSWTDAFKDLQDALLSAKIFPQIEEIWMADGTYFPSEGSQRLASFTLQDTMTIYGGFAGGELNLVDRNPGANVARLSGDIGVVGDSTDNTYHVVLMSSGCTECLLDGVTVSHGNANGAVNVNDRGAGVLSFGKSTLQDLVIEFNTSSSAGGAVYNSGGLAQLIINACLFRNNISSQSKVLSNDDGAELNIKNESRVED